MTAIKTEWHGISPDPDCPVCGNDDVQQWADDGESADADWWECEHCGAHGAFTDPSDPSRTVNGIDIARRIVVARRIDISKETK